MKTLEIPEQRVLSAYAKGDESIRAALREICPDHDFTLSIMDRVKSYEDACAIKGASPFTIEDFARFPEEQREYLFAVHKDDVINEVLNEGWAPDWSNDDEYKYYPYFYWDENAAGGSGFSCYDCACDVSSSSVGSRRVYKTSELAVYAGKQFIDIHRIIHNVRTEVSTVVNPGKIIDRSGNVMDRIKSYQDACDEEGIVPLNTSNFSYLPEKERESAFAAHQIATIARALNGDWKANWGDHSQYKYYPYFFHPAGGSGFSFYGYSYGDSHSYVGSRHVFKSSELATYAGKQFIDIYNKLYL